MPFVIAIWYIIAAAAVTYFFFRRVPSRDPRMIWIFGQVLLAASVAAALARWARLPAWSVTYINAGCVIGASVGVISCVAATWSGRRRVRHRRRRCVHCDYVLVKNISGVCPECGMPIDGVHPSLSEVISAREIVRYYRCDECATEFTADAAGECPECGAKVEGSRKV